MKNLIQRIYWEYTTYRPDMISLCNEGNLNDQKRNFIKIDFLNKKYDVAVVKDYYNEEEMLIFEIKDVTDISIEEKVKEKWIKI